MCDQIGHPDSISQAAFHAPVFRAAFIAIFCRPLSSQMSILPFYLTNNVLLLTAPWLRAGTQLAPFLPTLGPRSVSLCVSLWCHEQPRGPQCATKSAIEIRFPKLLSMLLFSVPLSLQFLVGPLSTQMLILPFYLTKNVLLLTAPWLHAGT